MPRSAVNWMPRMRAERIALGIALLGASISSAAAAQSTSLRDVLPGWIGLIAAPGRERAATDAIMAASPGWMRGALGTLVRRAGSGTPRRVIACALDRAAFSISEITADGFLRVHDAEPGAQPVLWNQFHEGQRVLVQTGSGVRPGVFAVRSTHLWRRRPQVQEITTTDDLWLDVGARSAAEVAALGIALLDVVVRELPAWRYGDGDGEMVAGPGAAARAGCAAVAAMASAAPTTGENIYVIATQSSYANAGLSAALTRLGAVDELVTTSAVPGADTDAVTSVVARAFASGRLRAKVSTVTNIGVRARFERTLVESVREVDVDAFAAALASAANVSPASWRPVRLPPPPAAPPTTAVRDGHSVTGDLLGRLADVYGVSGHEAPVRDAVRRELPAWARALATVDSAGDLVLALGPDRDTSVVMAHLDEIGFEVSHIARDGTVSLATRGGFYFSLWEGQPALLHVGATAGATRRDGACAAASEGPLRGVFVPRDSAMRKQPGPLTAWFGLDSAALVAHGVTVGSAVSGYKCATRLAGARFTARAIDDRAGSAALILAVRDLDPKTLAHKVIFVWSVREEIGLDGARATAANFGPSVKRIYAVDTFVSSDSPIESSRFAHIPIGTGAVVRALDNSSVAPPDEVARVVALARARRIPIQVGTTNGGNDGSELTRYGALDVPLSWPSRYSHSPVELLDLRDVRSLADVVKAVIGGREH